MVRFDSTGPKSRRISFEAEGQRYLELLDDFVAKERPHA
jgi:hypothetical protein